MYIEPKLYYADSGDEVPCTITNYKPPRPVIKRIANKPLSGHSRFQIVANCDTSIKFSIVFNIESQGDINEYIRFMDNYNSAFIFQDEFNRRYAGLLEGDFDVTSPIEGDIYYISVEMLCTG